MPAKERQFGDIPGVPVGARFPSRAELAAAGVHRPTVAGISGTPGEGADSIVLNGGYEDDEDYGDVVIYTEHGGNDPTTKKQVADQQLKLGNLALAKNYMDGLPVRVVRGWREPGGQGPSAGYRYDGLYSVERYWSETGRSGFKIWRYRLVRAGVAPDTADAIAPRTPESAPRRTSTVQRIVRNTAAAQLVKELHRYRCQICSLRLETPAGPYAEGAHIGPLGRPHDGPDEIENILCLCPNHHVLFDSGAVVIDDDLRLTDTVTGAGLGHLRSTARHPVRREHIVYHRGLYADR